MAETARTVFREANAQIEDARERLGIGDRPSPYICECPDERCTAIVMVWPEVYARARANGGLFLVAPGHDRGDRVVEQADGHAIVEERQLDERTERIGRNEALFRTVNERVKKLNEAFSVLLEHTDFVCECGLRDCTETIRLSLREYEQVRSDSTQFAILPGHELPDVESVVARNERYAVVRKHEGGPADLAEELDPRS